MKEKQANKAKLYKDVFNRKTSYVPLTIKVTADSRPYTNFEAMREPQKAIENAESTFKYARQVGSDVIPFIESNFMEVLIPSIFGAKVHEAPGGFIDVKPCFESIYETEKITEADVYSGEMENAIRHLEYLRDNAPSYLYKSPSRPMSPLDYAVVLCGGEFYTELYAEPELAVSFMEKIADATIKTIKIFESIINQPSDECMTPRGMIFPGIRLTGDAVVNLSPAMIEDIMCPMYKKFQAEFGQVMLHYCCAPAPSAHVIGALARGGGVQCVDNWQGYKTLVKEEEELQTEIGICTDVDKDLILSGEIKTIPFFNGVQRPLTVSTKCDTVDEGRRIYEKWLEIYNS